jgi:hypothetical protein
VSFVKDTDTFSLRAFNFDHEDVAASAGEGARNRLGFMRAATPQWR